MDQVLHHELGVLKMDAIGNLYWQLIGSGETVVVEMLSHRVGGTEAYVLIGAHLKTSQGR